MKPTTIKKMILDILGEVDEDLRNSFEEPEDPESKKYLEISMKQMIFIVQEYIKNDDK